MVTFSSKLGADNTQNWQGLRAAEGTGVLVTSECIGESPRKENTEVITKTSSDRLTSYASNPSLDILLQKLSTKIPTDIDML
jgi:hypothetical protein